MKKLTALALTATLTLALGACSDPGGEDTADMAPDAVEADVSAEGMVGDASEIPDVATVQAALGEACPTLRNNVSATMCEADDLGQSMTCTFAFETDPAGAERSLTLAQANGSWTVESEPEFCDSLDRAAAMADEPADASVDTQPTE